MSYSSSRRPGRNKERLFASLLVFASPAAHAQFALPGAITPAPEGSVAAPADSARARQRGEGKASPVAPKLPNEDAIVGRTLRLDGYRSSMELQRNGADLEIAKLAFEGDRVSRSGETCRIDVQGAVQLQARESADGLRRYQINFPACPFVFDVLEGAVLANNGGKACVVREADCRTDPNGLWGMGAAEFDPKQAKDMLEMRARIEQTVRNSFKALYDRSEKDKTARKDIVREQAGFSSWREEICRSYKGEAEFGYCALRVTEARAVGLGTRLTGGAKKQASSESTAKGGGRRPRSAKEPEARQVDQDGEAGAGAERGGQEFFGAQ